MEIIQGCKTCKWNFDGVCADEGVYGYGGKVSNEDTEKKRCWEMSFPYFDELAEMLPERVMQMYFHDDSMTHNDLLTLVEHYTNIKKQG